MTRRARVGAVLGVLLGLAVAAAVVPRFPFNPLAASVDRPDSPTRVAEVLRPDTYTLTLTGDVDRVDVTWSDGHGRIVSEQDATLPWSRSVTTEGGRRGPLIVLTALAVGDGPGTVSCRITRGTAPVAGRTGTGPRPFANCHGI